MDDGYTLHRPQDQAQALRGIQALMGGPETAPRDAERLRRSVEQFLAYAEPARLDLRRQVQAFDAAGHLVCLCLWVPAPGRTAMLFVPNLSEHPQAAGAAVLCVHAALADASAAGVVLVQSMLDPQDTLGRETLAQAGLTELATLSYMERRPPLVGPTTALPEGLALVSYSAARHEQFKETIASTYRDTLDCPALSGLRDIDDVIAGHKAVGPFEPALWQLLLEGAKPVGVLLLSAVPARNALELVYLGLIPEARGRGYGQLLMNRTLSLATRRACALATLAVDSSNVPALRLYRHSGYWRVAERLAMIRKLP